MTTDLSASESPAAFGYRHQAVMADRQLANLEFVRKYLSALERGAIGDELAAFFCPDVEQIEFPNRLVATGARRDLSAILEGAARGRQVLRRQRYEVRAAHADGDAVILEMTWVGVLAVPVGTLAPGNEMRANFAAFIELRNGRIARQRNYDCFDPF